MKNKNKPTLEDQYVNELQEALEEHTSAMEKLVDDAMADKGDTSETCQRRHLLNQIMAVSYAIDGISLEDMKKQH